MGDWLDDLEPETIKAWGHCRMYPTELQMTSAIGHSKAVSWRKQVIATENNTAAIKYNTELLQAVGNQLIEVQTMWRNR